MNRTPFQRMRKNSIGSGSHLWTRSDNTGIKLNMLLQRKLDLEVKEVTAVPAINKNSKKLLAMMAAKGRVIKSKRIVTGDYQDAGHEEETFVPNIESRSKNFSHEDSDVYNRLYKRSCVVKSCGTKDVAIEEKELLDSSVEGDGSYVNLVAYRSGYGFLIKYISKQ